MSVNHCLFHKEIGMGRMSLKLCVGIIDRIPEERFWKKMAVDGNISSCPFLHPGVIHFQTPTKSWLFNWRPSSLVFTGSSIPCYR